MIEQYLASLRQQLPGPRGAREELLRELGDGLRDAASIYQMQGMPRDGAERRAVQESGRPAELVPQYRETLAVIQGRRTAATYALTAPASILAWAVVWSAPGTETVKQSGASSALARFCWALIDYAGAAAGVVGVAALVLLMFAPRLGWSSRRLVQTPALVGMGYVALTLVGSTVGNLHGDTGLFGVAMFLSPALLGLGVFSLLVLGWQGVSSLRTIRVLRMTAG